jgi:hypothetical protein
VEVGAGFYAGKKGTYNSYREWMVFLLGRGAVMAAPTYCPYCDSRALSGGAFCPSCGRELGAGVRAGAPHHPHQDPVPASLESSGWWSRRSTVEKALVIIGVGAAIIVLLVVLGAL